MITMLKTCSATNLARMVLLVLCTGCHSSQPIENGDTFYPFFESDVAITIPPTYSLVDVWSPDSDIVKLVHPEGLVEVYFEYGVSGNPDYSREKDYQVLPVRVDGVQGEMIVFSHTYESDFTKTVILRFPQDHLHRAWAHCQPEQIVEAQEIMKNLRWNDDY